MSANRRGLFDDVAWERFLRIGVVIAFVTGTFVFTAAEVLPGELSTIAVGAIGSIAIVTAIIGFLIAAASTFEHAEERAETASDPVTKTPSEQDVEPGSTDTGTEGE